MAALIQTKKEQVRQFLNTLYGSGDRIPSKAVFTFSASIVKGVHSPEKYDAVFDGNENSVTNSVTNIRALAKEFRTNEDAQKLESYLDWF